MAGAPLLTDTQTGFAGGINPSASSQIVASDEVAAMTNVRVIRFGEIAKRPGLRSVFTGAVSQMATWSPSDAIVATSITGEVVATDGLGAIKYGRLNGTTLSMSTSATADPGSLAMNGRAHFRDGTGEVLYLGDSATKIHKWNYTSKLLTNGIGTPSAISRLWVYNQRLFGVAGTASGAPNTTLYWSGLNNGDTLGDTANGGGSATIRTYGDGPIYTGFALGGTNFMVHQQGLSMFVGRTFDDIQIQAGLEGVTPTIISTGQHAVYNDVCYMPTTAGLAFITANGSVTWYEKVTGRPDPLRVLIKSSGQSVFTAVNDRAGEIWFNVNNYQSPLGGSAYSWALIYNVAMGRYTGFCNFGTGSFAQNLNGVFSGWDILGNRQLFFLNFARILACDFVNPTNDVFQDNGANYTSSVQCRRFFGVSANGTPAPFNTKAWYRAMVQMGPGALGTAAVGSSTGVTASFTAMDGTASVDPTECLAGEATRIQLGGKGQYGDMTITDSGTSSTGWSATAVTAEAFDYGQLGR